MAYADQTLLQLVGVSEKSLAKFAPGEVTSALSAGAGWLDTYLAKAGYKTPVITPSAALGRWNAIVTAYDMMVARGYNSQLAGDVELRRRYEEMVEELRALKGSEGLDLAAIAADAHNVNSPPVIVSNVLRGYLDEDQQS